MRRHPLTNLISLWYFLSTETGVFLILKNYFSLCTLQSDDNTTTMQSFENSVGSTGETTDHQMEIPRIKSDISHFTGDHTAVANLNIDRLTKSPCPTVSPIAAIHNRNDADEKWWQAQYGFYLELNRKQQFKMKKMISELQLEFEYENLENGNHEIIPESRESGVANADPLR